MVDRLLMAVVRPSNAHHRQIITCDSLSAAEAVVQRHPQRRPTFRQPAQPMTAGSQLQVPVLATAPSAPVRSPWRHTNKRTSTSHDPELSFLPHPSSLQTAQTHASRQGFQPFHPYTINGILQISATNTNGSLNWVICTRPCTALLRSRCSPSSQTGTLSPQEYA